MPSQHNVVIAGGGVAGLEALAALRALAGDRVRITLIDPGLSFVLQAMSVTDAFAGPGACRYLYSTICEDHGVDLVQDVLASVESNSVTTAGGAVIPFDSLIVAVGARREPAFREALTFRGLSDAERMHDLIGDLEGGYLSELAFVVPPGVTWSLPLYELALLTAERADAFRVASLNVTIVTPETRPLESFGQEIGDVVADALLSAGIRFIPATNVAEVGAGAVIGEDGCTVVEAQRVVALPRLVGPRMPGLPCDDDGFLLSDAYSRVINGMRGVYAVGDGSSQPIKQGGVGAQQATTAARHIAGRAGADVEPTPFEPVVRAKLLTGSGALYLRRAAPDEPGTTSGHALWWPPSKVAAPYLTAYLERLDGGQRGPARTPAPRVLLAQGDPDGGIELLAAPPQR
jgi:sulfide:quinone oxidoreductase